MTVKLSIDMQNMTLGDLYTFVDSARQSGKSPDEPVTQIEVPNMEQVVDRLEIDVTRVDASTGCYINADRAEFYAGMVDEILMSEGDARSVVSDLKSLRELLAKGF